MNIRDMYNSIAGARNVDVVGASSLYIDTLRQRHNTTVLDSSNVAIGVASPTGSQYSDTNISNSSAFGYSGILSQSSLYETAEFRRRVREAMAETQNIQNNPQQPTSSSSELVEEPVSNKRTISL